MADNQQKKPSMASSLAKSGARAGVKFIAKKAAKKVAFYAARALGATASAGTTLLAEGAIRIAGKLKKGLRAVGLNISLSGEQLAKGAAKLVVGALLAGIVGTFSLMAIFVLFIFMVLGSASYVASQKGGSIPDALINAPRVDYQTHPELVQLDLDLKISKAAAVCQITSFTRTELNKSVTLNIGGKQIPFSSKRFCFSRALNSFYPLADSARKKEIDRMVDEIYRSATLNQKLQCVGYLKALKPEFRGTTGNAKDYYDNPGNLPKGYSYGDLDQVGLGDVLVWPGEAGECSDKNLRACGHIAVVAGIQEGGVQGGERYIITTQAEGANGEIIRLKLPQTTLQQSGARAIVKR
jgi:hypothetical protein